MQRGRVAGEAVYAAMIGEAGDRLRAAQAYLERFGASNAFAELDSAALQLRKALECVAFASIAPHKPAYAALRAAAKKDRDFTRDYHAAKILQALSRVNNNFYPRPLRNPTKIGDGSYHFDRKSSGFLTRRRFEAAYDRLGKHLHAQNPWGPSRHAQNLAADLPRVIEETFELIELHVCFIQTADNNRAWVVEVPRAGGPARVLAAAAVGPYAVSEA